MKKQLACERNALMLADEETRYKAVVCSEAQGAAINFSETS
jgi:hypothetical protein